MVQAADGGAKHRVCSGDDIGRLRRIGAVVAEAGGAAAKEVDSHFHAGWREGVGRLFYCVPAFCTFKFGI